MYWLAVMVAVFVVGTIIGLIWADTSNVAGSIAGVANIIGGAGIVFLLIALVWVTLRQRRGATVLAMEQEYDDPEWGQTVAVLRSDPHDPRLPVRLANADLLAQAEQRWSGKVVPRIQMDDLLFTRPGDPFPFPRLVRVSFDENDNAYTFELTVSGFLRTADRAFAETAPAVLDAFLMQLAVDELGASA